MTASPVPVRTGPTSRLDPARLRAWLVAAVAVLLVLLYLTIEFVYASSHLQPARFHPAAPGAAVAGKSADFRLLSLRRTDHWGTDVNGDPASPDPGAVWVVAELEVTPTRPADYLLCTLKIVSTDGRSWASDDIGPTHEGEFCAPDPDKVTIGTTYPFVLGYQVPEDEADHVAGLALDRFSTSTYPLLRPPA